MILNEFKLIGFGALIGSSDVDFEKPIVVTIAAHSDVCLHVLKHHLGVLDGDAPSPLEPHEGYTLYF